jgi:hypothetical protein
MGVGKDLTNLKTKASRKGVPMNPVLAEMLLDWRSHSPYPTDEDWVFASPFTDGERPYWPDAVLKNHLRPAARAGAFRRRSAATPSAIRSDRFSASQERMSRWSRNFSGTPAPV